MAGSINDLIKSFSESLSYGEVLASEQLARISAAIVKARIDKGMTQTEFAEYMDVSQTMVSKWESEDYNFTIESLAKICEKLDWEMNVDIKPRVRSNSFNVKHSFISWTTKENANTVITLNGAA